MDSFFSCIWFVSPMVLIWNIWWERNKRIFRKECNGISNILKKIECLISKVVNAQVANKKILNSTFTSWHNKLLSEWKTISLPFKGSILINIPKPKIRKEIKWKPLDLGHYKLNFDGASNGNLGISGIGFIIRNHLGVVLQCGMARIANGSNNVADAQALLFRIRLDITSIVKKIRIEGDSMNTISALSNFSLDKGNWRIEYAIQEVRSLLSQFEEYTFSHFYKEANSLADLLANQGFLLSHGEKTFVGSELHNIEGLKSIAKLEAIKKNV
ncbi:hypothetical protein SUGI_0598570 [Cryptomeria japonica]|nr:hypothetical protein SUGI_0598570 [Cryptomeria japonica]